MTGGPFPFETIKIILHECGYTYSKLPVLPFDGVYPQYDYISFLKPNEILDSVVKFRDRGREGVAIRLRVTETGQEGVFTFFQRYTDRPESCMACFDYGIRRVINKLHDDTSEYHVMQCKECPFENDRFLSTTLRSFFYKFTWEQLGLICKSTKLLPELATIVAVYVGFHPVQIY